jgi:hypothetical protein
VEEKGLGRKSKAEMGCRRQNVPRYEFRPFMNLAHGDPGTVGSNRVDPSLDGDVSVVVELAGSVVVPTSVPPLESGVVVETPAEGEDPMELFERHLKEQDWGHQPC